MAPHSGKAWCGTLGVVVGARVEHVGSLLRPRFLRHARDAYARGELTPAGLKAAEDQAVRAVGRRLPDAGRVPGRRGAGAV